MCMEDIRIGQNTNINAFNKSASVAGSVFFGYNPNRLALSFSPNTAANTLFIQRGEDATAPIVFILPPPASPLILNIKDHGALVFGPWFLSASAATLVGCSEVLLGGK